MQAQHLECHFSSAACRRPVYSLRVNRLRVTLEELQQRLRDSDVECEPSPFLPNDFLRVLCAASLHPGLQKRPASYCDAQQRTCGQSPSCWAARLVHLTRCLGLLMVAEKCVAACCAGVQESEGGACAGSACRGPMPGTAADHHKLCCAVLCCEASTGCFLADWSPQFPSDTVSRVMTRAGPR